MKNTIRHTLPHLLLLLTIVSIIAVAVSIYFEYRARQRDYLKLLNKQASLFIQSLAGSTQNAITAAEKIEHEINTRILASIKLIERYDQNVQLSKEKLEELLQISSVEALQIYNLRGIRIMQVSKGSHLTFTIPSPVLQSLLNKVFTDTVFTIYDDQNPENERLAAFVPRSKGGLIAAIIGKEDIRSLRRILGIGYFLKRFQYEKNVEYIVIQNLETIVAGTFNGYNISTFSKDPLLQEVLNSDKIQSRIIDYDKRLIFETLSPFNLNEQPYGVLRLGLSMQEYEQLRKDVYKRLYIFTAVLIVFGIIFVNFLINYRHRKLLHRDLEHFKDYTNIILENLLSGVISIDHKGRILTINKQALLLLGMDYQKVIYQPFTVLPSLFQDTLKQCLSSIEGLPAVTRQWIDGIENSKRLIALRANLLEDKERNKTCILLFDDITDQTRLEEQTRRNQRLTAMRNLASAVAHEIKNPLNSIKLIVDLIKKKYKPVEEVETYSKNLDTVQKEITRVNDIIEQYLRYARPPRMSLTSVFFPDLIAEIANLFKSNLEEKNITLKHDLQVHKQIKGDIDQLKQVFINLIKNAEEAIKPPGEISIIGKEKDSWYEIRVCDNGKGIPEKDIHAIFDFHFSRKKDGSGIGLSVVQQIITAHNGKIDIQSEEGKGTTVVLQLPY